MDPESVHAAQTVCTMSWLLLSRLMWPFAYLAFNKCHIMSSDIKWLSERERERGIGHKVCFSSQTPITDGYKLQQPVHIKYAMDNWWALDMKSVLVPCDLCVCVRAHVVLVCNACVCVQHVINGAWTGTLADYQMDSRLLCLSCLVLQAQRENKNNIMNLAQQCLLHIYL